MDWDESASKLRQALQMFVGQLDGMRRLSGYAQEYIVHKLETVTPETGDGERVCSLKSSLGQSDGLCFWLRCDYQAVPPLGLLFASCMVCIIPFRE